MTDKKMAIIPKGTIFTVTHGAYSMYLICGVFRATEDIDPEALKARWIAQFAAGDYDNRTDKDKFFGWVCRMGLFEPVPNMDWYLGDYGLDDEMDVVTPDVDPLQREFTTLRENTTP